MFATRQNLCRVTVHYENTQLDATVPALLPVAELIPQLWAIAADRAGVPNPPRPAVLLLSRAGHPPLPPSTTLADNGIRDGEVLLVTVEAIPRPQTRHLNDAAAVTAAGPPGPAWTGRWSRRAATLTAVSMATAAGFVVVPGQAGLPRLILASAAMMTAATVAVLTSTDSGPAPTVIAVVGGLILLASAGVGVLPWSEPADVGVAVATSAVVLLALAGRVAMALSGLTVRGPERASAAHRTHIRLETAAAAAAALGVVAAVAADAAPHPPLFGLIGIVGAALLLRARRHPHAVLRATLLGAGTCCAVALLLALQRGGVLGPVWLCVVAAGGAGAAIWSGFGTSTAPPILARWADAAEFITPATALPVAAWAIGVFDAVRGFGS